jgi:dihydroorotase
VDNKSEIKYLQSLNSSQVVHIHPIGGLSQNGNGEDIAELYDMREAGAIAFSDGSTSVEKSGLLLRAMQYVKPFKGLIIDRPVDASLTTGGQIHEGAVSVALGLRGIPSLAETTRVYRNIQLLEYAESRLHFQGISSAESLSILRKAKAEGLHVFASVPVWNLVFSDENLRGYDTQFKLLTPLRNQGDRDGLRAALKEGLLSAITSDHTPLESDRKDLEFPYADFGATSLETTFALANTHLVPDILSLGDLVERLANGPRRILGLEPVHIQPNSVAELTIYDPTFSWTPDPKNQASKSYNSPLYNHVLHGKVIGVIRGKQQSFN